MPLLFPRLEGAAEGAEEAEGIFGTENWWMW